MKRSEALASLSRDHHQALVVAQKLRRATDATAPQARETFLAYWTGHGRRHFRLEEELLFPAYAGYGDPYDPRVLRALGDHAMIRHRAGALAATPTAVPTTLEQLGAELAAHVRLEEREVFPMVERVMPSDELEALAQNLEAAQLSSWNRRARARDSGEYVYQENDAPRGQPRGSYSGMSAPVEG